MIQVQQPITHTNELCPRFLAVTSFHIGVLGKNLLGLPTFLRHLRASTTRKCVKVNAKLLFLMRMCGKNLHSMAKIKLISWRPKIISLMIPIFLMFSLLNSFLVSPLMRSSQMRARRSKSPLRNTGIKESCLFCGWIKYYIILKFVELSIP